MTGDDDDRLLDTAQVSELLAVPEPTLRYWRSVGEGPPSFVIGPRLVRYWRSRVLAWIAEQEHLDRTA